MGVNMGAKADNPQSGDLVRFKADTVEASPWIVLDFFPWGCGGKHAWTVQNPATGRRVIAFKADIERVKE